MSIPAPADDVVDGDRPVPGAVSREPLTVIRVLGAFEAYRDGVAVAVPHGLPRQAVKLVIARGGSTHTEVLADTLWPGVGASEQLNGVRNVLARLGRSDCPLLIRDGEASTRRSRPATRTRCGRRPQPATTS